MALSPGTRIGAYEIRGSLGAGGMGEVYRAHDPRLGRDVALKVLPPDVATDPARLERFTRETRAVAALNHPNIVTIHSTEEADGVRFFTMELVEGQTLDALIGPGGLPVRQFLDVALPLADALTAAHQKGITHRDLKPGNVIVASDARVKVLDFGLARIGESRIDQNIDATRADLTHEGTIVGTMPYMSPEQIEGKPLDHRSDLFSLGVMYYEMLSGTRPFTGESSPLLMSSILKDLPRDLTDVRPEIPAALSRLVSRCVEKRVDDRVQTARDVYNELRHLQKQLESGASRPEPSSSATLSAGGARARGLRIAVLPFTARARDDEASVLAEGLTDDVTAGLSKFSHLNVVSRARVGAASGSGPDVRSTTTSLDARYLLEGSIRRAGNAVRVGVKLTDTESGAHLWAENYDRDLASGTFALQDDVAKHVIATVGDTGGVLVRSMAASLKGRPSAELSVSELVLQYHIFLQQLRSDEHARLRADLEAALKREPLHADGWAALANLFEVEHSHELNPLPNSLARSRQAAERAVEVDPLNQLGWQTLASSNFFARDRAGVRFAAERAIAINPLSTVTVAYCGMVLAFAGDWDRGLAVVRQAMVPNPHYPGWIHFVPFVYHYQRREYAEALQHVKQVNMPLFHRTHVSMAAVAGQLGARAEAQAALEALATVRPSSLEPANARGELVAWMWDERELDHVVDGIRKAKALVAAAVPPVARDFSPANTAVAASSSIAVLPFDDMSAGRDQEWFCDGIAEEILNALAQLPGLRVAARTSAFSFRGKGDDLHAIGEKLKVGTVLEGSVRRSGDRLRINVQLVDVANGFQLWSERFDRELKDIFDVQDEIARAIAARLRLTLSETAGERLVPRATSNIEAYEQLLKGRTLLMRRGRAILEAQPCFERAISLDPQLVEAHALLADSYRLLGLYGIRPPNEMMPRARAAVERALAIDANQVEALATLANVTAVFDWDIAAAVALSDRALAVDPTHVRALAERSILLAALELPSTGIEQKVLGHARRARELDPLNAWVVAIQGFCLALTGRPDEAAAAAHQAVALDQENFAARWALVWTLAAAGRHDETLTAADAALAMSGRQPRILTEVAAVHAARGDRASAEAVYQELRSRAQSSYIGYAEQAAAAASAGHTDQARDLLRRGIDARDSFLIFWKLPSWAPLRADAEALALVRTTGLTRLNA